MNGTTVVTESMERDASARAKSATPMQRGRAAAAVVLACGALAILDIALGRVLEFARSYPGSAGLSLQKVVSNIALGRTIYVRLWTLLLAGCGTQSGDE